MNKKLIALLIAVVMLFAGGSINISYVFASSDGEDIAYKEAVILLEALNTKAFSTSDKSVSYNSFNDALSTILSGENVSYDISKLTGIAFSDPTGNGLLTYNDAIRSLVNLLGYKVKADANGASFASYINIANSIGILEDVNINNKEYISARDAAVMVANALNADMLQIETFGTKIDYKTIKGETLLYVYRDIKCDMGVVEANEFTDFFSANGAGKNKVKINGIVFDDPDNKAVDMVGYAVKYHYIDNPGINTDKIVSAYIDSSLNNILVIDNNFSGNEGRKIYYTNESGKERDKTIPGNAPVIYNGTALSDYDNSVFDFSGKYAELIDNNSDNKIDVVIIKEAQDVYVENVDTTIMALHDKIGTRVINLSDSSNFDRVRIYDENKNLITAYGLNKGDILSTYINKEGNLFDAYLSKKQINGKITEIEEEANGNVVALVANERIILEKSFYQREKENLILGTSGVFYINFNGEITYADYTSNSLSYAYLMDIDYVDGPKSPIVGKLLLADGSFMPLTLKDSVKIDNKLYSTSKEALAELKRAVDSAKTGVVRYDVDDNGLVYVIDTAYRSIYEGENTLYSFGDMSSAYYYGSSTLFPTKFMVDANKTVLFFAPSNEDFQGEEHYGVGGFSFLTSSANHIVQGFGSDRKNLVPEVVVCDESIVNLARINDISRSSLSYFFKDKVMVLDEDDEETYKITYYQAYSEKEALCYDKSVLDGIDLEYGDAFVANFDVKGRLSKIRKVYDAQTHILDLSYYEVNDMDTTSFSSYCHHNAGYVYYVAPTTVNTNTYVIGISNVHPSLVNSNTEGKVSWYRITNTSGTVFDYSYHEDDVRHSRRLDPVEIKDYMHYGNDCARAYIRVRSNSTSALAIYQK